MIRTVLFLALLGLGFAPVPMPRRQSAENSLAAVHLAGTWRISTMDLLPNNKGLVPATQGATHVVIDPTKWAFRVPSPSTYSLTIDHSKRPAAFDLTKPGEKAPYGRGIIRREGREIRVVYRWDGGRPTGFENQLAGYDLLLVRE